LSTDTISEIKDIVKDIEPSISILDIEGKCLYTLVLKYCPQNCSIVEIGSWKGRSTIWLAKAAQKLQEKVYAIDPHIGIEGISSTNSLEEFKANIERAGVADSVLLVRRTSQEAFLSGPLIIPSRIDLVFIDGDHSYEEVDNDVWTWMYRVVGFNGVIALHDTIAYKGPRDVVSELFSKKYLTPVAVEGQIVAFIFYPSFLPFKRLFWFLYWKLYSLLFVLTHTLLPASVKEIIKKW